MSGGEQYTTDDMPMEVMCEDLFDQIDDLLDFPNYYYDDNHFEPVTAPIPPPQEPIVAGKPDTVLPFHDEPDIAADLEWVSNFMDDTNETFSLKIPSYDVGVAVKKEPMVRTASPNSVLNGSGSGSAVSSSSSSSSSYSSELNANYSISKFDYVSCQTNPIISAVPARPRTKRPRPHCSEKVIANPQEKKKITIKIKNPNPQYTAIAEEISCVRKCLHCEVTKTPQWRAGPMGPKTLCNACGVRYKSGRLFPEYRPAASPTFVPAVHSNSHKKVVEMRIQKPAAGMSSRGDCDLLNYIRRRD